VIPADMLPDDLEQVDLPGALAKESAA